MLFQVNNNEINKSVFLNKLIIIINKTMKGALHVTDKAQEKELKPRVYCFTFSAISFITFCSLV